jgi:hypothetical protein
MWQEADFPDLEILLPVIGSLCHKPEGAGSFPCEVIGFFILPNPF